MGNAWTADYLKITGELDVDLRSNIAAEARAKIVYERLINFCDDAGTKDALQFLMTREITHMKAFAAALESMGKPAFSIGRIPPTPGLVDQFFNDSTGEGDDGEIEPAVRGTRAASGNSSKSPALQEQPTDQTARPIKAESSPPTTPKGLQELLVDQLRDILHAEKQLTKALPKMAKAARLDQLRELFETASWGNRGADRAPERVLRDAGRDRPRQALQGHEGLVEEGQEVMEEGEEKEDAAADLALIGAAQRVEHYEISGYTTARNLAQQLRHTAIVALLSKSLAEEENADQLLNQVARSLMSVARMPAAIEQMPAE